MLFPANILASTVKHSILSDPAYRQPNAVLSTILGGCEHWKAIGRQIGWQVGNSTMAQQRIEESGYSSQ